MPKRRGALKYSDDAHEDTELIGVFPAGHSPALLRDARGTAGAAPAVDRQVRVVRAVSGQTCALGSLGAGGSGLKSA
jgi:hypothetical protein